jgi:hypothetical protein
VNQIIPLGSEGGAGNSSEVLRIHINETVLDANGAIDQHKIVIWFPGWRLVLRSNQGLFEVHYTLSTCME